MVAKRMKAFLRDLDKMGKRMSRRTEAIMRGACGTQSWSTPFRIYPKEPGLSRWRGSIIGWPL
jgi:hypothetical protein